MRRRFLWFLGSLAVLVVVATVVGGLYLRYELRASLPQTDGAFALAGLAAPVAVERDAWGVPTITASTRADAARALGFLHAQERFFQMDLQRRQAAGELAALVGARALEVDRGMRLHRFRHIAQKAIERSAPEYRAVLDAYAEGVNAGVQTLGARPFEYLMLRASPEPWRAEDTILTILAMFNTLQGRQAAFEATFGTIADAVSPKMYAFLTARGSEWDAPVVGDRFTRPSVPGPAEFDLRNEFVARLRQGVGGHTRLYEPSLQDSEPGIGSNNWAVAGSHTATGAALIANDMHLNITMPNIWYRASMVLPDGRRAGQTVRITGVTLPGVPSMVVGSNGFIAWGFTNSGGDWSDLVVVEPDARNANHYLTPDGPKPIERFKDPIAVKGAEADPFESEWTIWGPIVRTDFRGRRLAQHWVAHDIDRLTSNVTELEQARTVEEALRAAAGLGIPAQNVVVGDTTGTIGWTIGGPIPRRVGFDGSRPTSWADGTRRWNGYLTADEQPRVVAPATGRLWTANSAVVTDERLAAIGEGGYADGIRARIIRDRLMKIEKATGEQMLSVQLDSSALFHERWRTLVLDVLHPAAVQGNPGRAEFRALVEATWSGSASPESVSYLLVRTFRTVVAREVFGALTAAIKERDASFDYGRTFRSEGPLWQLVTERPRHLLTPAFESWDAQLLSAVDTAIVELTEGGQPLARRSWSTFNRAVVTHPLGGAMPLLGRYVNMPADPLPGDVYTPRAHSPRAGPSERMVVSPGREQEGILHMPGGQSGHPLSPHYSDQHRAWLTGAPLPFLPGPAVARLSLTPARAGTQN
jgi:penicillin amidase